MDWNLIFRDDAILEINYAGKFSNDSFLRVFEQIILDPRWKPGIPILADFREVDFNDVQFGDVLVSVNMHSQFDDYIGENKFAATYSNDNGLRLGQLYKGISSFIVKSKISTF